VNIYEATGIGYIVLATTVFTFAVFYLAVTGLKYVQRLLQRGQSEENLDLRRSESIKRELANVE
jgi:tellurite resistance protein TehA-like permease